MNTIKDLMLQAIDFPRPMQIQSCCLPIWNQPFFYHIDKARVLTISYNPTDKGARLNYPNLLAKYKCGETISANEIYDLLYNFKKETYWRDNYDLLFKQTGIESEFISHMDMSFFPYRTFNDYLNYKIIDKSYEFLFKTIEMLGSQLKYILIDGSKNADILPVFLSDYTIIDYTKIPINSGKSHPLQIYKHKTLPTYLIYYGCQIYGQTCPAKEYVIKLGEYIKSMTQTH